MAAERHSRFQQLRQLEQERALTEAEQAELALLVKQIESEESLYLVPATKQLQKEREILEEQNSTLENLIHRKEALASRLRAFLNEAQAEREAIQSELAAVLTNCQESEANE